MSTENMKSCLKDLHSSRSHKGLFHVFFGKGIKTGFKGKKNESTNGRSSKESCVVITTRKFRSQKLQKLTPTIVNSYNT